MMTSFLARAAAAVVAPPDARAGAIKRAAVVTPPAIAVIGTAPGVTAVANGIAARARMDHRTPVAVLLGGPGPVATATSAAARRLAVRLTERGIDAVAAGRAVHIPFGAEACNTALLHRVRATVPDQPIVTVLSTARDDEVDALLSEHDGIVAVLDPDADDDTDALVLASLATLGPPITVTRRVPNRAVSLLVRAGFLRPESPLALACEQGQSAIALVGLMLSIAACVLIAGAVGAGAQRAAGTQRAADLAALAGARAMRDAYPRMFFAPDERGALSREQYLAAGRDAARRTAAANGAGDVRIAFPDHSPAPPLRIRVTVEQSLEVTFAGAQERTTTTTVAEAELAPGTGAGMPAFAAGGGYSGRLAYRQGKPMRPDVALAFDRMERAARADGVALMINSGYRTDAEQAILWARNPNPAMVAPPGRSLHRNGTELDIGPPAAYGWLAANALRFGFLKRYPHEGWHFGYIANARSRPASTWTSSTTQGDGRTMSQGDGRSHVAVHHGSAMPSFVPERYAPVIARAAQRWNVSAALLAAQIHQESGFDPHAVSNAGAQGIAQFMPATAAGYGLRNPFDAEAAIDAQAHFMHDLLQQFSAVPLALAAYNAGPGAVARCMCIPPYPETQQYVALILGLLGGAGDLLGPAAGSFGVRLVR